MRINAPLPYQNVLAKLYCGQPGTGKTTLLKKLYQEDNSTSKTILCPTNQLIEIYTQKSLKAQTIYKLLKLTPKTIPSKHLNNFGPLQNSSIKLPQKIFIDEIFMFSYQEIYALLKCIQIQAQNIQAQNTQAQNIQAQNIHQNSEIPNTKTQNTQIPNTNQNIQTHIYMFGDPFQLKCTATSIAQQANTKQGGNGVPIYWYHAFKDFDIEIDTIYLQKLYRFDETFGKYISDLKNSWREQLLSNTLSKQNKLPFDVINIDSLKKYISQGYVVLVGTHRARTLYQQKIFQQFKTSVVFAKDGKKYRLNGPVYTLSDPGQSFQKKYTLTSYDQISGDFVLLDEQNQSQTIIKPKYKNKTSYQIAPGDVLTVNVVQGRELPGVIIDMQSLFEFGSFYTAISRCKKISDIKLITITQLQFPDLQNEYVIQELLM